MRSVSKLLSPYVTMALLEMMDVIALVPSPSADFGRRTLEWEAMMLSLGVDSGLGGKVLPRGQQFVFGWLDCVPSRPSARSRTLGPPGLDRSFASKQSPSLFDWPQHELPSSNIT